MLKSDKTEIEQISRLPIILLAGAGLRLKKDFPGPKGLAQVGKETILSLQLQRFNNKDFQKPIVVIREEEKISYETYLTYVGLEAILVVDENPIGPPSSLKAAIKAVRSKPTIIIVVLGDSICTSNRILEYAMALQKTVTVGAISVARTNINNLGSTAVIRKGGLLLGFQSKESGATWRWAGIVIMPFEWADHIPVAEKLLPQIVALSNQSAYFKIVEEPGGHFNVNTIVELCAVNRLFDV